ncbi:hypothetical protein SH139x_002211 [Planctomycetaceae bacterium SH139]
MIPFFLPLLLFFFAVTGCNEALKHEPDALIDAGPPTIAQMAKSIGEETGWDHFSVDIAKSEAGCSVFIHRVPGSDGRHLQFFIDWNGVVTELDVP